MAVFSVYINYISDTTIKYVYHFHDNENLIDQRLEKTVDNCNCTVSYIFEEFGLPTDIFDSDVEDKIKEFQKRANGNINRYINGKLVMRSDNIVAPIIQSESTNIVQVITDNTECDNGLDIIDKQDDERRVNKIIDVKIVSNLSVLDRDKKVTANRKYKDVNSMLHNLKKNIAVASK